MGRLLEGLVCLLRERGDGAAKCSQLRFGLAHEFHEDFALTSALAAKATHDFGDLLVEAVGLAVQLHSPATAPLSNPFNQLESFFGPCTGWSHP